MRLANRRRVLRGAELLEPRQMLAAAAGEAAAAAIAAPNPVPAFSLEDVNATSATHGQHVSPRDSLYRASGWYFGHST